MLNLTLSFREALDIYHALVVIFELLEEKQPWPWVQRVNTLADELYNVLSDHGIDPEQDYEE